MSQHESQKLVRQHEERCRSRAAAADRACEKTAFLPHWWRGIEGKALHRPNNTTTQTIIRTEEESPEMETDSDHESIEGHVEVQTKKPAADWGKTKFNYYFTDYVDKDYPSDLTRKEERLAALEQDEALRLQKKLLSTIDNVQLQTVIDLEDIDDPQSKEDDVLEFIETQNRILVESRLAKRKSSDGLQKKKKVKFEDIGSDECEFDDEDGDDDDSEDDQESDDNELQEQDGQNERKRRPINMAIKHNRGLTPYKKKEYRNPRVKHKLKYKKAMTKRRKLVKEAKTEFHRYSGETTGIKTSSVKSIKLS